MGRFTGLIIMDGFGIRKEADGNAIAHAGVPNINALLAEYPHTQIGASGLYVGLPDGQMGNSEVGHLNIGAGRIVYQELTRITKSIADGDFFENEELVSAMDNAVKNNSSLHVMGLLSDGGVHSHMEHIFAVIELAKRKGLKNVFVHCFMDGRDVPPNSGKGFIEETELKLKEIGVGKIASVSGRYFAMDRDNRWERISKAFAAIADGEGRMRESAADAMSESYDKKEFDEFIEPTVITENGKPVCTMQNGDSVIFCNFRPDRARELTRVLTEKGFNGFEKRSIDLYYVCMTQYDKTFENVHVAFKPHILKNTFGEYISKCGLKQFRIAETEKYAHVTFFFNGGVEKENPNEDRYLIPSPKVATYDLKPEMSAFEVADKAVEIIKAQKYDVMVLNFANTDMVGHTGDLEATEKAVKTVDECVKKVVDAILSIGGQAIITADHGNCEYMWDKEKGVPFTAHTTNPVPLILVKDKNEKLRDGGILADIAPTLLDMLGIEKPEEMSGNSLILH